MREGAKKRLIGAVVIVALAVIFVPMLFEPESLDSLPPIHQSIPTPPSFDARVKTETFLGPQDSGVGGFAQGAGTISQPLALPPVGASASVPGGASGRPTDGGSGAAAGATGRPPADPAAGKSVKAPPPTPIQGLAKLAGGAESAVAARGAALSSWVAQAASFPSAESAEKLGGELRAGGFTAFVEKADVNGRVVYRVLVGPELERGRAEQTVPRLREKHKLEPFVKSYP